MTGVDVCAINASAPDVIIAKLIKTSVRACLTKCISDFNNLLSCKGNKYFEINKFAHCSIRVKYLSDGTSKECTPVKGLGRHSPIMITLPGLFVEADGANFAA